MNTEIFQLGERGVAPRPGGAGARALVEVLAAARAKALAVGPAEGFGRQGQEQRLPHLLQDVREGLLERDVQLKIRRQRRHIGFQAAGAGEAIF